MTIEQIKAVQAAINCATDARAFRKQRDSKRAAGLVEAAEYANNQAHALVEYGRSERGIARDEGWTGPITQAALDAALAAQITPDDLDFDMPLMGKGRV